MREPPGEFDLIDRIRRRAGRRADVVLGIGDDAALLVVPAGHRLVVTTDTLNAGVHFPVDTAPADIGWKALAVNLSDLAAMGATPAWCTLSLSLPVADAGFLDAFLDGFSALASAHRVALIGGDTTRGPLSVGVTAMGFCAPRSALRRDGARVGDDIWVSGTLGDAAAALALRGIGPFAHARAAAPPEAAALAARLDRPTPRVEAGLALVGIANACIDVSDGLLADLAHIARRSGVAAEVDLDALPASAALCAAFDARARAQLQATGGDDYELCFTAPPGARDAMQATAQRCGLRFTRIGRLVAGTGVTAFSCGNVATWARTGYVHFE